MESRRIIPMCEMNMISKPQPRIVCGSGIHLVLLGNGAVGKTSIAYNFIHGKGLESPRTTIGGDWKKKTVELLKEKTATFYIFDTSDIPGIFSSVSCRSSQAAVVVYDINNAITFENAKLWIADVKKYADENVIIVLAGNKSDLADEPRQQREIQTEEARAYAEKNGFLFTEVSARTGIGIQAMFSVIAEERIKQGWRPEDVQVVLTTGNGKKRKRAIFKK